MLGNSSEQERTFSETLITVTLGELDEKINTTLMPVQSIRRHSQHLKTAILPAHLKLTDYHVLSCILIVSCKHKPRDVFPGYNAMFCRELLGPKIHVYPNIQSVADEEHPLMATALPDGTLPHRKNCTGPQNMTQGFQNPQTSISGTYLNKS